MQIVGFSMRQLKLYCKNYSSQNGTNGKNAEKKKVKVMPLLYSDTQQQSHLHLCCVAISETMGATTQEIAGLQNFRPRPS